MYDESNRLVPAEGVMTLLGRSYLETQYRCFSNIVMRWVIDHTLIEIGHVERFKGQQPLLSGLIKEKGKIAWPIRHKEFLWNAIRYWSERLMMKDEAATSWAYSWRRYVCGIPDVGHADWDEWDALFSVFLRDTYLKYWHEQFTEDLPLDVRRKFWNILWVAYAKTQDIDVESSLRDVQPVIEKEIEIEPFNIAMLNRIDAVLEEMCRVARVPSEVAQPIWGQFPTCLNLPIWDGSEIPDDWDVPLVLLASAAEHRLEQQAIVDFLERNTETIGKWLATNVEIVCSQPTDLYEFWFPLQNHTLPPESEVSMGPNSKIVGISEELARRLNDSKGIGPRPASSVGDAYIVISVYGKTMTRAYEEALRELGRIQTMLRVADTGFRWETGFYYFVTVRETDRELPKGEFYIAYRRDNRQVFGPLSPERLTKYRDWLNRIEKKPGEIAEAVLVAMKWQGLSRVQDGAESEFLCLWIALERLGNGNYHYKKIIPRIAGSIWHWPMWSSLPADERFRGIYQDRILMERIVEDLGDLRSSEVAHRGEFRGKKDVRYATWVLKHLVNDLIRWIVTLMMERDDIRTFEDLTRYVDQSLQLI